MTKLGIHEVPLAVAFMHVSPRTNDAQVMQHTIEKPAVISRGSCSTVRPQEAEAYQ
ncbi:hypothetical protein DmGdi_25550 [Gluconobacter sp. Gdi]|nr:hypothetical protein DmGdi_25550 [Gluconobacter sp. Gdi]